MTKAVFHDRRDRAATARWLMGCAALALLAACANADLDLRDLGNGFDTTEAALAATATRPEPDNRGVISYPGYQVAIARRGDTVADVANRVGLPADELARFNGAPVNAVLNRGEVLALPRRVSEPSPATGAVATGPILPASDVDVVVLAGEAIDRAESGQTIRREQASGATAPAPRVQSGEEPVRHKVVAGETAFSIARRYNVPLQALAEWNGLDRNYTVRTGQFLMIPPTVPGAARAPAPDPTPPGAGSPTPTPPSAAAPLPQDEPSSAAAGTGTGTAPVAESVPASPNLAEERTGASGSARFVLPVSGSIVRDFGGETEGIVLSASPGDPVRAADAGTVRTITADTIEGEGEARVVIVRHDGDLSTVYVNVRALTVSEGARVARGAQIGEVGDAAPPVFQFQVRQGSAMTVVDPNDYIR